ncbi:hypothetical protein CsatB_022517 [Cannabis sativa]
MFSIAAINDTNSKGQWEPLAPTKEAQEFHLSQTYQEGLLKLQAKEYEKARQLLESVLKDPLIANAQVDESASDGHLLQLRFLALKNLANVFLQQGSLHYENALHCYLQAVEIDTKDSVVWNQLGTLSCSMGLLSISRWAFEQGLLCSPNNWNCMEKLLEVLIAIGDEVACLSVTELILRHWPSHSRALHVKQTIEDSEPVPFAPRGIDKLEPKHVRLKFLDKRKAADENLDEGIACKKLNRNLELHLAEASWVGLADALLDVLLPLNCSHLGKGGEKSYRSGDVKLIIHLRSASENASGWEERKTLNPITAATLPCDTASETVGPVKEKDTNVLEEQPQERRSTRLERLRNRKPGKEDLDFTNDKDQAKVVIQYLEPYISGELGKKDTDNSANSSFSFSDPVKPCDTEYSDVTEFLKKTSNNCGAYHMAHLLLEDIASKRLVYQDTFIKFLDLEKMTRHWGKERTPECNLFLAELYYDIGSSSSDTSKVSEFVLETSYHLCKIIESVALDHPNYMNCDLGDGNSSIFIGSQCDDGTSVVGNLQLDNMPSKYKKFLWVRYFWLSGRLSILEGHKEKALEQFSISLSLLTNSKKPEGSQSLVHLPHCKVVKEITIDRVLHQINFLKVDFLMEKTLGEMIEKELYMDCMTLLAPLLFSTKDVHLDTLSFLAPDKEGEEITSIELSALDILLKACEKATPLDFEVYLNCHRRKLQILMAIAGMDDGLACKSFHMKLGLKGLYASDVELKESSCKRWNSLVSKEVKAISQCVSQIKNLIDPHADTDSNIVPASTVKDIQSLLLSVMCNIAGIFLSKKASGLEIADQIERHCFVEAAIAFCKLQHLNLTVPVKTQVDLIVAMHDLLAEYGLCCAGEDGSGEEGIFLKFSIKHLLALDMKLKSNNFLNKEKTECLDTCLKISLNEAKSETLDVEMGQSSKNETSVLEKDTNEGVFSQSVSPHKPLDKNIVVVGGGEQNSNNSTNKFKIGEKVSDQFLEGGNELTEDEKEELELKIDNALDQCFFCLYGLNIRSDSSYEDDLATHRNTSRGDYQTKEQCADVFLYILPYAKASSRTGLVKLRRVLRAIRKHFPQPPIDILAENAIDKFLDDPDLCEDQLSEEAGSDGFLESITKAMLPNLGSFKQHKMSLVESSEPYLEVYSNLYYFLALSEEMSATDKWPGFVLTKEGEEFVQHNANLFKYDLLYNPLRFESWERLANIYDEEVDLLLNDGSKHINVSGWRKNAIFSKRVDTSRKRSRRCLLMSLALAKTSSQQCEIHELLALVYYDSLQNVVPFYDQRSVIPIKDAAWMTYCENSMRHFKKAFAHKQDWSDAYYIGKLCEKLGFSSGISLSYYDKSINLNPSAVDSVYRMHASRLKLLFTCGKQNLEALKVLSVYSFSQSNKDAVLNVLNRMDAENARTDRSKQEDAGEIRHEDLLTLEVWRILYSDCLSALEACVEGDLKHFHKARYMLAQSLYKRGDAGDLEKAKDELSFCFKSSRSSFTINMWEIDSTVKKGRRKNPGISGSKKILEVNLPESSRKFITCIRKYLLFYLKLLEETGDICTLERAYVSLRADKRFSLCIEDLVPVALGRYVKALVSSMGQAEKVGGAASSSEQILEKLFSLFIEQGNLWPEICSLSETKGPETSESSLYGYLHEHITLLERNGKLEILEGINEKIRKRFKNPKLSNSNCAKVCRHASVAWCRSLIISLGQITPSLPTPSTETHVLCQSDGSLDSQLLCVDLQIDELWNSAFENPTQLKALEIKWRPILSKMKHVMIKKVSDENLEAANALLKSSYNFHRESSCVMPPSGVNLFLVPSWLARDNQFQPSMNGIEILDLSVPRKLILWAYTLLHGRYANISVVVKYCEENAKSKMKKGAGTTSAVSNASIPNVVTTQTGGQRDGAGHGGGNDAEATPQTPAASTSVAEGNATPSSNPSSCSMDSQKVLFAAQQHSNYTGEKSNAMAQEADPN